MVWEVSFEIIPMCFEFLGKQLNPLRFNANKNVNDILSRHLRYRC